METRLYRIKVFKEKTPYFWVAYDEYDLNVKRKLTSCPQNLIPNLKQVMCQQVQLQSEIQTR